MEHFETLCPVNQNIDIWSSGVIRNLLLLQYDYMTFCEFKNIDLQFFLKKLDVNFSQMTKCHIVVQNLIL